MYVKFYKDWTNNKKKLLKVGIHFPREPSIFALCFRDNCVLPKFISAALFHSFCLSRSLIACS